MKTEAEKPPEKKKKHHRRYAEILRHRRPTRLRGGQDVPMDIDKLNASLEAANS